MIWNWLRAILAGVTIVLSRSMNGDLSQKSEPYKSTFFNYFTGLITSIIVLLLMGLPYLRDIQFNAFMNNPLMLIGGGIGVFNILILNIILPKIPPIQLTLINFISQLLSGIVLDYCFYQMFSIQKFIGCLIVIIGLSVYQLSEKSEMRRKDYC